MKRIFFFFFSFMLAATFAFGSNKLSVSTNIAGYSVQGRPVTFYTAGAGNLRVLYFGVFHGNEPMGKTMLDFLLREFILHPEYLDNASVIIVPVVNPDGLVLKQRDNFNGKDINRNFPTKDRPVHSNSFQPEPETLAVMKILDEYRPDAVISIHAPLFCVNYDGPARELAEKMSGLNQYPIKKDIGYPVNGSFGTYAGKERNYPVITLELPEKKPKTLWKDNKEALIVPLKLKYPKE